MREWGGLSIRGVHLVSFGGGGGVVKGGLIPPLGGGGVDLKSHSSLKWLISSSIHGTAMVNRPPLLWLVVLAFLVRFLYCLGNCAWEPASQFPTRILPRALQPARFPTVGNSVLAKKVTEKFSVVLVMIVMIVVLVVVLKARTTNQAGSALTAHGRELGGRCG